MRPLHILLLNEYFPPDTAATAQYADLIARALAVRHHVTVLTSRPSYEPLKRHPRYLFRRERDENLIVERVGSTAFSRVRMSGRLTNYVTYLALALPRALSLTPDAVIAMTDPPVEGIFGAAIARFLGCPFIYNIRDLYPDMALAAGIVHPAAWTSAWEASHVRALRQAAQVVVLGEDMRQRIMDKGIAASRVTVIRDAVPVPEVLPHADASLVREIRASFRFVIVHAGNLGFSGSWNTLLRTARMLETEGVGLVFIGEGAMKDQIRSAAKDCRNVRFLPFRPASDIPAIMAAGDLQVVTIKRGLEGLIVPSKLYNILAYGRPILALATEKADVTRLTQQHGCGITADPDDANKASTAIRELLHTPEHLQEMSRQARNLARTYDRFSELQKFVDIIEEAAEQHASE